MTELKYKDAIIKILSAFHPEARIYLFGSYARGEEIPGSDIDIGIDIGRKLNIHEKQFLWRLLDALPTVEKIDLVDVNRVPSEMHDAIVNQGITWKS